MTTVHRELTADEGDAGERLDVVLARGGLELSRAQAQRLIEDGLVLVDGRAARASLRLKAGQRVSVTVPPPVPSASLEPQAIPLRVLYQDDDLLVVDKPPGLPVHPAPGHPDHTLVNALLALCPDLRGIGGEVRPGIVHRLDKDTSGLMVVAKSQRALQRLTEQFKERALQKVYLALVRGRLTPAEGVVDAPIARDPRNRKRMAVVSGGRAARTRYHVLRYVSGYTVVEAFPETGRTHQIRVHFAHLGHALAGDAVYGRGAAPLGLSRHFLHAHKLAFRHPVSGAWLAFEAPLPPDLAGVVERLGT